MKQWKDVPGYEGLYKVSDAGEVMNRHGRLINSRRNDPYAFVRLSKDHVKKDYALHRIVLMAFDPKEGMEVDHIDHIDHIDHNPQNNNLSNLRWVTQEDNLKYKRVVRWLGPDELEVTYPETGQVRRFKAFNLI